MEKDMLWLACGHYLMEIMLEAVVSHSLGPSSGPDIQLFKRFKKNWDKIDLSDYKTIIYFKSFYFAESSRVVYSPGETKRLSSAWCK